MRLLKIIFYLWASINFDVAICQESTNKDLISFGISYNTFMMNDHKEQNDRLLANFPIEGGKITNSFPPYLGYEVNYRHGSNRKLNFGALVHFTSTGGRVTYSDFSGVMTVDQLLDYYSVGVIGSTVIKKNQKILLYFDLKASVIYTGYQIRTHIQVFDESYTDNNSKFYSIGLGIQPGLTFFYNLSRFKIGSNIGIEGNINSKLKVWGGEGYVVGDNHEPTKANWSGLRLGLIFGYTL